MASHISRLQTVTSQLLQADPLRMDCLQALAEINLDQGMIAAGFIRNLIWDHQHGYRLATPFNDVDVVWFEPKQLDPELDFAIEDQLRRLIPNVQWQVRNQARMHLARQTPVYLCAAEAVSRYPETATCLAVALNQAGQIVWGQSAGLADAWSLTLKYNPLSYAPEAVFKQRVLEKQWQTRWPKLAS